MVVCLQDEVLYGRIRFVDGLRGHLNVGTAHVCVVDSGLECAIRPRFRDQGADEALVREGLLRRKGFPQQIEEVACKKDVKLKFRVELQRGKGDVHVTSVRVEGEGAFALSLMRLEKSKRDSK